jgi:hypothetical protein
MSDIAKHRCADWLDEDHSLIEGEPVFVRCVKAAGHDGEHSHGRFEWGENGWNEQLPPELADEIARLADDIEGGGE